MRSRKNLSTKNYSPSFMSKFYVVIILLFFYLPIFSVMVFSFNSAGSATRFESFSLKWYVTMMKNDELLNAVQVTVTIAILATLISTILGVLGSLGLAELNKKYKGWTNFILNINNLPVVNPDIVTAVSLMALFMSLSAVFSFGYTTMLLAHIAFCTPYVVIQVYPKVLALDPSEQEAAMDLGATRFQSIVKVVLPDLSPAIISGAMMAFTMSFDDFVISYFVGGKVSNISTYVYSMRRFKPEVNALSTLIFLFIGIILVFFEFYQFHKERNDDDDVKRTKSKKIVVSNC